MATAAEILAAINTAILAIMNGGAVQSYTIGNRNVQKMNLRELMELRAAMRAEVQAASGTDAATVTAEFEE